MLDREPSKNNIPPETYQPGATHKVTRDPKRTKLPHHTTTTTTTPETYTPTHNTPHTDIPNTTHPRPSPLPDTYPKAIQTASFPPTPNSPHPQTHQHHISSPNENNSHIGNATTTPTTHPCRTPTTSYLSKALNTNDHHIKTLIQAIPDEWSNYNEKGSLVTKRQLLQCAREELKESDSLQAFQQAIITSIPPPTTTVTLYTTHLTSAICMDNIVWRHNTHNACQDKVLPHPLFYPTTIFNIHNNSHFTTLIANNHTYYYYDSLNLRSPQAFNMIHNILRQWYTGLEIAPPILRQDTPIVHIQRTPQQANGWTCG
jgi:hypothetical protein